MTGLGEHPAAQLVAAITLATGILFLLLAALRMGWIARFLSRAVVTGFLAGAAVDVVIGELSKLTGTSAEGDTAWREFATWLSSLGSAHGTTVLVAVVSLAVILGLRFLAPAVPGALVLVSAACSPPACSISARMESRSSETCREVCRHPNCRTPRCSRTTT